jgi:hypothetical protein
VSLAGFAQIASSARLFGRQTSEFSGAEFVPLPR